MRHRTWITLSLLALFASACGTALSDEQALTELQRDGGAQALAAGAGGAAVTGGELVKGPYVADTVPVEVEGRYVVVDLPDPAARQRAGEQVPSGCS